MSRDGITVSIWIWIIGGLMIGALTMSAAYFNLIQIGQQNARHQAVDQYESLNSEIDFYCRQATGARTTETVSLRNVRAIFTSNTRGEAPVEAPNYIAQQQTAKGEYVCMSFDDGHYNCIQHSCSVNMTYVGTPLPGSDMYSLGSDDGQFTFDLTIRKDAVGEVRVEAEHIP